MRRGSGESLLSMSRSRQMTLWNKIAYGSIDFYGGGAFFLIGSLYLVFLTVVVGLSPIAAGAIIFLGKIWAAVANAAAGYISDHTASRFGRRRTYFLLGLIPVFAILWLPVTFADSSFTFIFHLSAYLVYNTLFAFTKVPYNSILSEMTNDYRERSQAMGVRMVFSQAGMLTAAFVPLTIVAKASNPKLGYLWVGIIFGVIYALPWIVGFFGTWEQQMPKVPDVGLRNGLKKVLRDFRSTADNRSFVIHMAMYLLAFLNMDLFNGVIIFFVVHTLGMSMSAARDALTIVQGSQLLAIPVVTWISGQMSQAAAYRLSLSVWGFGMIAMTLVPTGAKFMALVPWAIITGLGLSGAMMIPWNIQTFMADVDELITTKRREGVYAGVMQFIRQIAVGLGLFFTNAILEALGFLRGSTVQSGTFGIGLRYFMLIAPIIILGLGIFVSRYFLLDSKRHKILLSEINRLKLGGKKSEVLADVRLVSEQLTGFSYDLLWQDQSHLRQRNEAANVAYQEARS